MRIGTRGSALALAQARLVADQLEIGRPEDHPPVELVTITTTGDRWPDAEEAESAGSVDRAVREHPVGESRGGEPSASGGHAAGTDKSRWVLELERALSSGEIDVAVHSA
jgi:hydroxymethylbilane synthase